MASHQNNGQKSRTENKKHENTKNKQAGGRAQSTTTSAAAQANTVTASAYPSPEQTPNKAPSLSFNHRDSGYHAQKATPVPVPGTNYEDFTLFLEQITEDDLELVDIASVKEYHGSLLSYDGTYTGNNLTPGDEYLSPYNPSRQSYANTDSEDYILSPLGEWEVTFHRHEHISWRLLEPYTPQTPRS